MIQRTIKIFHADSLTHLIIIFVVFAITGCGSVLVSELVDERLGLRELVLFYPIYLIFKVILVVLIYQVCLLAVASVFGQFKYFLRIQKRFLRRIRIIK